MLEKPIAAEQRIFRQTVLKGKEPEFQSPLRRFPLPKPLRSILLIRLGAIGDVVQTLPVVEQLKLNYPEAQIYWVIEEKSYPIVKHHPGIKFILFPKKKIFQINLFAALYHARKFGIELKKLRLDLALDLQGLFKTGFLAWLSGAKLRVGYHSGNSREGNHLFQDYLLPEIPERKIHRVDFYQQAVLALGGKLFPLQDPFGFKFIQKELDSKRNLMHRLRLQGAYIVINLGASKETKAWTLEGFSELICLIHRNYPDLQILLTGAGNPDGERETQIVKQVPSGACLSAVNKTTLRELALLVHHAKFLISGDSLALHLGSAFKIPSIGIFGGSALPVETKPYWESFPGLSCPLPCYPCRKKTCSHHSCMNGILASKIFEEFSSLYERC
jgi:heptosyltransferase I